MLSQPPVSVNVFMPNVTMENWSKEESLSENHVIIPLLESKRAREFNAAGAHRRSGKTGGSAHNLTLLQSCMTFFDFGLSLAFAVTYHKLQGQTLDRVILDLNSSGAARLDIPSVYVGVSRVREGKHIRMLPLQASERLRLLNLEFDKDLLAWYRSNG